MSHEWLIRVLAQAGCPRRVLRAIELLLRPFVAILRFKRSSAHRLIYLCGLRQGGPLSLLLYVLCVDPLLCAFDRLSNCILSLGFVDDWLACTRDVHSIARMQILCDEFADASGQKFNQVKSVVLVELTASEVLIVKSHWRNCEDVVQHNSRCK